MRYKDSKKKVIQRKTHIDVIDHGGVLHTLGPGRKLQRGHGFCQTHRRRADGRNQTRLGIATQRILQEKRQLTVSVRNVHGGRTCGFSKTHMHATTTK
jgi:hypothetical protein